MSTQKYICYGTEIVHVEMRNHNKDKSVVSSEKEIKGITPFHNILIELITMNIVKDDLAAKLFLNVTISITTIFVDSYCHYYNYFYTRTTATI